MDLKKTVIAVLLNLFAIPGAGQMYLKRKRDGIIIMVSVCAILLFLLVHFEMSLFAQIKQLKDPMEALQNIHSFAMNPVNDNPNLYWGGGLVLSLLWLYAMIDIFLTPKKG